MRHVGFLRFADIPQKRSGCRHRRRCVAKPGLVDRGKAELLAHARSAGHVFVIVAAHFEHAAELFLRKVGDSFRLGRALVHDKLARREAAKLVEHMAQVIALERRDAELARRDIAERRRALARFVVHRAQVVALALLEHRSVRHRAGCDYPYNIALYKALGRCRVLYLLADGDLVALGDQPRYIRLAAVIRNAAHRRALLGVGDRPVARGQRKVKLTRGNARVLVEHLVKIPEAEKQQTVAVLRLDLLILHFHRCKLCHFFSSALALLLYIFCVNPVSKLRWKPCFLAPRKIVLYWCKISSAPHCLPLRSLRGRCRLGDG